MRWTHWLPLIGVSVLVHLAIFWPDREFLPKETPAPALSVHLVPHKSTVAHLADPPGEEVLPVVRAPEVAPETSDSPSKKSAYADSGKARPKPTTVASRPKSADEAARKGVALAAAPGDRRSGEQRTGGELVSSGGAQREPASGTASLARYRLALAAAAVRMQDRTPQAELLSGTAIVEIRLMGNASVPRVSLAQSSGVERVDREAVALLLRAAQAVPVAAAGDASEALFRLPVVFEAAAL